MTGKWIRAAVFAALGLGVVVLSVGTGATAAQKGDLPDISAIMKKAHGKTDGYLAKINAAAKDGKWDDAQKTAKNLVLAGEALGKNKPPKGDEGSWKKQTDTYVTNAKAVESAADKKDAQGTQAAVKKIQGSCGACHKAHKQ